MRLSLVVAMTPERVIGKDGTLPWRLPADMRHFRRLTMGQLLSAPMVLVGLWMIWYAYKKAD